MFSQVIDIILMAQQGKSNQSMSNLRLSTQTIGLSPETQSGELIITNVHASYSLLFKIKTKIQKVMEVRPTRGLLKPGQKAVISFKPLNKLSQEDKAKYEKTLQFLLQGVNINKGEISKEDQETLWKSIKEKKVDISLGYCAVKIGINFSGRVEQKEFLAPLANYESKIDNKFPSNVKSDKATSSINDINRFSAEIRQLHKSDNELSEKYEQLKSEHQELERERQKLFSVKGKTAKSSSNTLKIIIVFVLFFLLGNFLKGVLEPTPEPVVVQEKGWFQKLFG